MQRLSFLSLLLVVALVSCLQGARAPQLSAQRTLDLEAEAAGGRTTKPFAVVFAGPKGKTVDTGEVTIVFNRPMRPLELAGDESSPPAKIVAKGAPPPKGSWRWMGTSSLIFAAESHLARATEYVVTVPLGTKALDGSTLAAAYTFSFSTPAPKLVRASPEQGAAHVVPNQEFELRFNQPVDPKEVERAGKVLVGEAKKQRTIAIKASWPKADNKTLVKVIPQAPLPLASHIELSLDASLHGLEGPLPIEEATTVAVETYGPILVRDADCWRETPHKKCAAGGSLHVGLTNRVSMKELRAHIRMDPAHAIHWPPLRDEHSLTQWMHLPTSLRPGRPYRLTVTAGLKDEYGQTLARDASFVMDTDDEWPRVQVGLEGTVFEVGRSRTHEIAIGAVNAASYELVTAALDESTLPSAMGARFAAARQFPGAKVETVRPGSPLNAQSVKRVSLDAILADRKGRGAVLVGYTHAGAQHGVDTDVRVVSLTDLAISAKMSRFGSVIWVSRLSDGKPVSGAVVAVRKMTKEVFSTHTDASGIAIIPADKYVPVDGNGTEDRDAILIARSGDDWAFRQVSEVLSPWRYQPSSDPAGRLTPMGMLFTDRGIYKTGEVVRVKALFRVPLPRGTETPRGREVVLEAFDSNGAKIFSRNDRLGTFGELAADIPIPAAARLGSMQLRVELKGETQFQGGSASTSVEVAAYRAAEFKVGVDPDKSSYIRGDKAQVTVHGDYLFGAPMSGGKLRYTVMRGRGYFAPPGSEDLILDDESYWSALHESSPRAGQIQSGDGALTEKGTYLAAVALTLPNQRGVEIVSLEAEVEDVSRQTIAGRASAVVHPAEFYVAMKQPSEMFITKGTKLRPQVAAIEPSGKRRANVQINIELLRRTWHTIVEASGESGSHYDSRAVDTPAGQCSVSTTAAPLSACELPALEAGFYIVRASAKDPRGNVAASSTAAYVTGDSATMTWAENDASKLDLVNDKKAYEIGDTAKILVKSPFKEGEALVTVERAGVYRQMRVPMSGPMPTLSIPITDDLRPNAYVSVHLVRGRTQTAPAKGQDVGAPAFRLGYTQLLVNPEARRLKIAITPSKKELRPGEEIDVDLTVTDRAGKGTRGEITFYAVDEGVLMLTGYKTPDPIPIFTSPRPLAVFSLETRADLAKLIRFEGLVGSDKGGDGGGGGNESTAREDFRATAYFQPSVVAGADGKAKVHFKLPDSLTTYRLMGVVAAEDDRFGFGETQIVTSRLLMARPALPRFLRAGDTIDAGVILSSKGMPPTNVEVTIAAQGATVSGDAKRVIPLPANGSVEVRWAIATPQVGHAKFTFKARAGTASDDVVVTREVKVPLSLETVALYGETSEAVAEKLGDLKSIRQDVGGLDVRLSSTALVGLDDGVEQLIEYPYGCAEQLASRLVPLIPLRELAKEFQIKLPANLGAVIETTVAKVLKAQHQDGGFGYWPDSPQTDAWLTAYVVWALHIAKTHGHFVPEGVIENGTRYLRQELARARFTPLWGTSAAFIVDVLATAGNPDTGYTNRLFDQRDKLPLFARALLAHAMVVSKMSTTQAAELTRDFENHLRVSPAGATVTENLGDEYAPLLDSEARTTAIVIRALLAVNPKHPLAARLAKGLLAMRHHGTWRSTQETAWALLALDEYRRAQETQAPDFDARVFMGSAQVFSAPFHGRSISAQSASFGAAKLFSSGASGSNLAFQVNGSGNLFYEARLRYANKELPSTGLDRGFFVRKVVRSVRPEALHDALGTIPQTSAVSVAGGDLVMVDLIVVTTDPREQVVIEDPLPAGLEAVQTNLSTTAQALDVTNTGGDGEELDERGSDDDARANDRAYTFAWFHREFHDDKVLTFVEHMPAGLYHYRYLARATTFGRFVVPPTRAKCMYEPETFGRTAATVFEVVKAGR